jgi:putative ABC transport system ATP-binding protein
MDDVTPVSGRRGSAEGGTRESVLISCKTLSKDYDGGGGLVRALREVDLDIQQGEFVAIVGTSGSGKSTLMNILGCLDRPTRGAYELAGFDIGARSSDARAILRNRLIGFIFQGFNLLPRTTALENVELPLVYRGVSAKERRKRAMESLTAVGLAERVHHTPNELSGGQQQRVAIARALVTSPPMLLADEPTGNLDTRTSLEVLALLQKLNRDRGITIVLVTHEHDIAACASRVVTFRDGKIVSDTRDAPVDAMKELDKLPPADNSKVASDEEESPAVAERRRLGGPVPKLLYLAMVIGYFLGSFLGGLYASAILDVQSAWIPWVFAFFFEALAAAWYAARYLGKSLTNDQRVRVALTYTLGSVVVLAPMTAFGLVPWSKPLLARLEGLSSSGVVIAMLAVVLGLATVGLARYLVVSLLSPMILPKKKHA